MRRLDALHDAEEAFVDLYGDSSHAFWLDSSGGVGERARFSFIGAADGPLGALVSYDVDAGEVRVERGGEVEVSRESIFDFLGRETRRLRRPATGLPFDFDCGFVGYFGYELKADCDGDAAHQAPTPDAAFLFADRLVAFDHFWSAAPVPLPDRAGWGRSGGGVDRGDCRRLASLAAAPRPSSRAPDRGEPPSSSTFSRSRARYLDDIAACERRLFEGDTYEVCLTDRVTAEVAPDPLHLYRPPAPRQPGAVRVLPPPRRGRGAELFPGALPPGRPGPLGRSEADQGPTRTPRYDAGRGRAPWAVELAADEKSPGRERDDRRPAAQRPRHRLRGRHEWRVPELMGGSRTYETVRQLVSSVPRPALREEARRAECIRACFRPGSMTGAPKKRTMEIIDELEGEARGVYSGAIGYLGARRRPATSASRSGRSSSTAERATIGAGGAIVLQSDPEHEWEEMLLKARRRCGRSTPVSIRRACPETNRTICQPRSRQVTRQ